MISHFLYRIDLYDKHFLPPGLSRFRNIALQKALIINFSLTGLKIHRNNF